MSTAVETRFEVPAWMSADIWAQACDRRGDVATVPRARIDMGGKVAFIVPTGVHMFLSSAKVYDAPEGGTEVGHVTFPVPRQVIGPAKVHCTLDEFSH